MKHTIVHLNFTR